MTLQYAANLLSSTPRLASCSRTCNRRVQRPFFHAPAQPRPLLVCASPDKDTTKEAEKLNVPDTAPAGSTPAQSKLEAAVEKKSEAAQQKDNSGMTVESIQQRAAELQAAQQVQLPQQPAGKESFWQGVAEEIFLIKWPSPKAAILNTLLVILIVGGTSGLLFAVNTLLAELSRKIYG